MPDPLPGGYSRAACRVVRHVKIPLNQWYQALGAVPGPKTFLDKEIDPLPCLTSLSTRRWKGNMKIFSKILFVAILAQQTVYVQAVCISKYLVYIHEGSQLRLFHAAVS